MYTHPSGRDGFYSVALCYFWAPLSFHFILFFPFFFIFISKCCVHHRLLVIIVICDVYSHHARILCSLSLYLSLLSLYLFLLFQLLLFLTFDFFCCCSHVMGILFGLPCPFSAIDKMEWRREREKSASHRSTNIPFIDCQIFCHWMRIVETLKRFPIDAHELITFTRNFYAQTDFKSKHTHTLTRNV